jgi:hypothetical protein
MARYTTEPPNAPPGKYVLLQYSTKVSGGRQVVETVVPVLDDPDMERLPLLNLTSGYVQRAVARFPRVGTSGPWTLKMAYEQDVERLREGPVTDPALQFTGSPATAPAA